MKNQREGVFAVVTAVCQQVGVEITGKYPNDPQVDAERKALWQKNLSTEHRKQIIMAVAVAFDQGQITMTETAKAKYDTVEKLMKEYVPGLVSNWLRKDERLNGGIDHEIKNPGSRSGSGDPRIKQLTILLKDPRLNDAQRAKCAAKIEELRAEIEEAKSPKPDYGVLKNIPGLDIDFDAMAAAEATPEPEPTVEPIVEATPEPTDDEADDESAEYETDDEELADDDYDHDDTDHDQD